MGNKAGHFFVICLLGLACLATPAAAADLEVGPGKTYATIGAALAAAAPNDVILVYPGDYPENVDLNTMGTKGNITFRTVNNAGVPQPGTATVSPATGTAFRNSNWPTRFPGNVTIEGFNVSPPNSDGMQLWSINGDVRLENVTANNTYDDGIDIWDVTGTVTLIGCTANSNADDGADISDVSGKITITDCTANENQGSDGDGFEIHEDSFMYSDVEITGCTANNNEPTGEGEGIDVETGNNVTIRHCTASGNGGEGIDTDEIYGNLVVEYCTLTGNEGGINVGDYELEGNATVSCNNISGNTDWGLLLGQAKAIDAQNNWWGDPSGPSGTGFSGSGDKIEQPSPYTYVDADPWLAVVNDPSTCPEWPQPEPTSVPTMGQWGIMLFSMLLGLCALLAIQRRRYGS